MNKAYLLIVHLQTFEELIDFVFEVFVVGPKLLRFTHLVVLTIGGILVPYHVGQHFVHALEVLRVTSQLGYQRVLLGCLQEVIQVLVRSVSFEFLHLVVELLL